jgi:bifunctional pyridoxal-dependent enzyme with beta-cystathionase and maltose regulon repressor activities
MLLKNNILILSDEIYEKLIYGDTNRVGSKLSEDAYNSIDQHSLLAALKGDNSFMESIEKGLNTVEQFVKNLK